MSGQAGPRGGLGAAGSVDGTGAAGSVDGTGAAQDNPRLRTGYDKDGGAQVDAGTAHSSRAPSRLRPSRPARSSESTAPADGSGLDQALAGAIAGDEAAFTRLYRLVHPGLMRYLHVLAGADAQDVASETWMQVCRDLKSFHGDGDHFRGWVARIGRNRALDHHRATRRRPADPWPAEHFVDIASVSDTEGQALERLGTAGALALIARLPKDQAEAVMLRVVMALDAKTAGLVVGKRPGSVRTSAYRGLKALADRLDSGGEQ